VSQEETNVTFYLTLKSWTSSNMEINMNFSDPLAVSDGINPDNIVVTIKNPDLFISKETFQKLPGDRTMMAIRMPRQFPEGVDSEAVEHQAVVLKYVIIGILIVILLISIKVRASFENLWNMYFTLQMIVYMDVFTTAVPANAVICSQEIKELIDFDFLNPERIVQFWLPNFKLAAWIKGVSSTVITSQDQFASPISDNIIYLTIIALVLVVVLLMALYGLIWKPHRESVSDKLSKFK
jgi:hypothetical protein